MGRGPWGVGRGAWRAHMEENVTKGKLSEFPTTAAIIKKVECRGLWNWNAYWRRSLNAQRERGAKSALKATNYCVPNNRMMYVCPAWWWGLAFLGLAPCNFSLTRNVRAPACGAKLSPKWVSLSALNHIIVCKYMQKYVTLKGGSQGSK